MVLSKPEWWLSPAAVGAAVLWSMAACVPATDPEGPWRPREPEPIIVAFDGKVLGADNVPPEQKLAETVHISVAPTKVGGEGGISLGGAISVQLAPGWYLDQRGLGFTKNSEIHVEGPYLREGGKLLVIATRVSKGGEVIELRDAQGRPLWPTDGSSAPSGPIKPTPK